MREMKRNIFAIVMMAILLALGGTAQAVSYKGTYKGGYSQPAYMAPATVPVVTFQSTSSMPVMMSTETLLNADGTVNAGAYGVGQSYSSGRPGHIRKADSDGDGFDDETGLAVDNIDNPTIDPNDPGNVPLGDGLWVLLLLAGAYVVVRRIKETRILGA